MKKHKLKTSLVVFTLSLTTFISSVSTFADTDDLQNEIESNKDKINTLQDEKDSLENEINIANDNLNEVLGLIANKNNELYELELSLNKYTDSINKKIAEIDQLTIGIENKELEIETKKEDFQLRKEMLDNRIRSYYKNDMSLEIIELILKTNSVADMLFTLHSVNNLVDADKDMMEEIEQARKDLEKAQLEMENLLISIEADKNSLQQEKNSLENTKYIYENEMAELRELESQKSTILATLNDEEASLVASIDDLNAENEALENKIQEILIQNANNNIYGSNSSGNISSDFIRPTGGSITSPYGYRIHPVTGVKKFHKGIDYGAGYGTPIVASKSGTVIFSGVNGGYGNCIMIDHGDGTVTLYAHNQSNYVSYGQAVTQGETIGTVGSTGVSTGPHLHFEIRVNGQTVDPYSYIPY